MTKKFKDIYVGKVFLVDANDGSVLLEGTGTFLRQNKMLHIHFETNSFDAIENTSWIPILETEDGYFSPASFRTETIVAFPFQASSRDTFSMETYFNWPTDAGLKYLFNEFEDLYIDIKSVPQSSMTFNKDNSAKVTVEANSKTLEKLKRDSLGIEVKLIYSTKGYTITPAVRYKIETKLRPLNDWLKIVHSYRLYWVLHNDAVNSEAINVFFGSKLRLHTNLLSFKGYTDNTYSLEDALKPNQKLNIDLFAQCINLFFSEENGKIKQSIYSFMAIRFSVGAKNIVDDPLRLVFSLDGFTSNYLKTKKKNKTLKSQQKKSINKILEFIDNNKDQLEDEVYRFYSKNTDQIYSLLSQRPFTESVQQSFEKLGLEYSDHEDTIGLLNDIRQTFVHGKEYDTQKIAKIIFTHSTHDIKRSKEGDVKEISFSQKMGIVDKGYQMLKELYLAYLTK